MPALQPRQVDVGDWSRLNIWPLPDGSLAVRPGLQSVGSIPGTSEMVAAFSLRSDQTDEVHHYLVARNTSTEVCTVYIYNEIYEEVFQVEWAKTSPEVVTHGVVNGQVVIGAPGFIPLWGFIGHPLYKAKRRANSINPDLTTQALPRGIVVGWANRIVYAQGGELYFSDAGDPRSIVGLNVLNPTGGVIYGLHVSSAGALIIVTTTGVYRFSREAAAAGQVVKGVLDKVCEYGAPRFGCTATVRGRVWGVTKRGVRLVDTPDPYEIMLADGRVRSTVVEAINITDFRAESRLYEGEDGLILSIPTVDQACMFDEASQTFSWWYSSAAAGFDVVGTLTDEAGRMIIVTKDGLVQPFGNHDQTSKNVYGTFRGRIPTMPHESLVMRSVQVSSDSGGNILVGHGDTQDTIAVPQTGGGVVLPTISAGDNWETMGVRSREVQLSRRTDDHTIEVGAQEPMSRIDPIVTVMFGGVEKLRTTN